MKLCRIMSCLPKYCTVVVVSVSSVSLCGWLCMWACAKWSVTVTLFTYVDDLAPRLSIGTYTWQDLCPFCACGRLARIKGYRCGGRWSRPERFHFQGDTEKLFFYPLHQQIYLCVALTNEQLRCQYCSLRHPWQGYRFWRIFHPLALS